ncbi:hypothetical protein [Amycolatopsis anabasis]|uniref:hypothetical protein n=1 Tax=Amycolatopsis anabasis TaxID=1840409 RepID=UPI00131C25B7|nr:hypothetical protein [Amycolatopsis anabasis]
MPTPSTDRTVRPLRRRFARVATEILSPEVWVLALPLIVAWQVTGHHIGETLLWGLIVSITGSVIPMAVIRRGARQGKWETRHVTNREGRLIPLTACVTSLAGGLLIVILGGAPHEMIALAASGVVCLIASIAITFGLHFKISMHAQVAALAVVVLAIVYGPVLLVLALLVAWVCWSRVELRDHTTPQVLTGALLGATLGGLGYWALATALV